MLTKKFRVHFEDDRGEKYFRDFPSIDEAEEEEQMLSEEGFEVSEIEELR